MVTTKGKNRKEGNNGKKQKNIDAWKWWSRRARAETIITSIGLTEPIIISIFGRVEESREKIKIIEVPKWPWQLGIASVTWLAPLVIISHHKHDIKFSPPTGRPLFAGFLVDRPHPTHAWFLCPIHPSIHPSISSHKNSNLSLSLKKLKH